MSERGSNSWRVQYWRACKAADLVKVPLVPGVYVWVAREAVEATLALGAVFVRHGYSIRPSVTGAYNCRKITGGSTLSGHAYAIAIDVNWDTNPYSKVKLITDIPREVVADVLAIRTNNGVPVWRWGGDWDGRPETPHSNYDAMHFEIVATPAELAAGISRSMDPSNPKTWVTVRLGSRGQPVRLLQQYLGLTQDGIFGVETQRAVASYQISRKVTPDGIVGPATWTMLVNHHPPVDSRDTPPAKDWK